MVKRLNRLLDNMTLYIGSDHAGYVMKEKVKTYLSKKGVVFEDVGTYDQNAVDYPVFAKKVAKKVAKENNAKGILICGTGTGMVIAANRIKGVRACVCYDEYSAMKSREDNNANVLCLRGRQFSFSKVQKILDLWLATSFSRKTRHMKRIKLLDKS